jgi:phosphatidate phosphatase PAH1
MSTNKQELIKKDDRFILNQDKSLPKCIICDIDGTISLMNGRSIYDVDSVHTDSLNIYVANLVATYKQIGVEIIYITCRDISCYNQTKSWLQDKNLWCDNQKLYMRPKNENKSDNEVKLDLYNELIKDKYYVCFVLEDRDSVVKMWRDLGLLCLQVYYGNF